MGSDLGRGSELEGPRSGRVLAACDHVGRIRAPDIEEHRPAVGSATMLTRTHRSAIWRRSAVDLAANTRTWAYERACRPRCEVHVGPRSARHAIISRWRVEGHGPLRTITGSEVGGRVHLVPRDRHDRLVRRYRERWVDAWRAFQSVIVLTEHEHGDDQSVGRNAAEPSPARAAFLRGGEICRTPRSRCSRRSSSFASIERPKAIGAPGTSRSGS